MKRLVLRRTLLICLAAALLFACPAAKPAVVTLGADDVHLSAALDGGVVTLTRGADTLLTFPADGVQLGTVAALDDKLSYDPYWLEQKDEVFSPVTPPGLRWRSPTGVTVRQDGDALALAFRFEAGFSATLTVRASAPGRFTADLVPGIPDGAAVAFVRLRPRASSDEAFYGLGEWFDSVNHRGKRRPMQMEADLSTESADSENHVVVPLLLGTRGWGLFVESRRPGLFDVAQKEPDLVEVTFGTAQDSAHGLRFHLFAAARPLDLTRHYYELTGAPALPAPWALGPWLWRNENRDQAQVLDDLQQIRARDLATTGLWFDRPYATFVNSFDFDARFTDPPAMFAAAKAQGLKVAVWHTPYLEPGAEPYLTQATALGYFPPQPGALLNKWSAPLDFTAPGATAWWQAQLQRYRALGVEGFKLDFAEDVVVGLSGGRTDWKFADGTDERTMHSLYTLQYHQAYAGLFGPEASFLLCRAGRWGDQVHAPIIWPGDVDATLTSWREVFTDGTSTVHGVGGLPVTLIAALSLGPSGFPFFASDTGGYRHGPPDKETFVRWVEQAALGTAMEVGDSSSELPWEFTAQNGRDDEALGVYQRFARLKLRLFPYVWTYAKRLATDGRPIQRALGLAYPELGVHPSDEYLLGDELLVAPVLTRGATSRTLTLPPGRWLGWWDGAALQGPDEVTVPAPLTTLPLFLRAGGMVPMLRPTIQTYAASTAGLDSFENDAGTLFVRVALGPASEVTLYDGTVLAHTDGGELRVTAGSVFSKGVMLEVIGATATSVALDGQPLLSRALPQLISGAIGDGWAADASTGGTVWIRVPAGAHTVSLQ